MTLLGLLVVLVLVGVLLYVVNSVIPMDAKVKTIVNAVAIVMVCLWVLSEIGVLPRGAIRLR
jgi:hypothetical protein